MADVTTPSYHELTHEEWHEMQQRLPAAAFASVEHAKQFDDQYGFGLVVKYRDGRMHTTWRAVGRERPEGAQRHMLIRDAFEMQRRWHDKVSNGQAAS